MVDEETRQKAIVLVRLFRSGDLEEEQIAGKLDELMRLIPNPHWGNLMFYQDPELSDEEVVEAAMAYRPFTL
jgi:hypothetical protein